MSTITTLPSAINASKSVIDTNFSNLNTDKAELSGATFTGDISVPDEAYWAGWNGSLEVPTKNAVYDKIETMWGSGATTLDGLTDVTITSATNWQSLIYESASSQWKNQSLPGGGDMLKSTYDTDNDWVVDYASGTTSTVKNSTGSTLFKGTIVYINGGTGWLPTVAKWQANAESTSAGTFGAIFADIANNANGTVVKSWRLANVDTRTVATNPITSVTLVDWDTIYLDPSTAGYITNVKPVAPNHMVYIGKVITAGNNGIIDLNIRNGYELDEIHDVLITSKTDNDGLFYESSSGLWKNKNWWVVINALTAKTTPVDADMFGLMDSAASNVLKKLSWANIKTALNSLYASLSGSISQAFAVSQLEVWHASDTTISRVSAGVIAVEGKTIPFSLLPSTATDGATVTFDLATNNKFQVTIAGNRTLALSNTTNIPAFMINIKQDATGSRTVTWFSWITWAGGSAPTLTTTANKTDSFGFQQISAGVYLGFVITQNI